MPTNASNVQKYSFNVDNQTITLARLIKLHQLLIECITLWKQVKN